MLPSSYTLFGSPLPFWASFRRPKRKLDWSSWAKHLLPTSSNQEHAPSDRFASRVSGCQRLKLNLVADDQQDNLHMPAAGISDNAFLACSARCSIVSCEIRPDHHFGQACGATTITQKKNQPTGLCKKPTRAKSLRLLLHGPSFTRRKEHQ